MNIGPYSFEEYLTKVKSFHGNPAPGMLVGGFMVDLALKHMPAGEIYDALSETSSCLPDAVQLLTPCTTGNGWLRVIDVGRFALALYDKVEGKGIRVFLELEKVNSWPEIRRWYLRLVPKKEQELQRILDEIREAGSALCGLQEIVVQPRYLEKKLKMAPVVVCSSCGETYPAKCGPLCPACQGNSPYLVSSPENGTSQLVTIRSRGEKKSADLLLEEPLCV